MLVLKSVCADCLLSRRRGYMAYRWFMVACASVLYLYTFYLTILWNCSHKQNHSLKNQICIQVFSWSSLVYFTLLFRFRLDLSSRFHAIPKLDNCMFLKHIFSEASVCTTTIATSCFYTIKFINQSGLSFCGLIYCFISIFCYYFPELWIPVLYGWCQMADKTVLNLGRVKSKLVLTHV